VDFETAHEAWSNSHIERRTGERRARLQVKGYGPHVEQMDRKKYCEELNRETFMHGAGLLVISVPHDDVERRPEVIESLLRMVLSRYRTEDAPVRRLQLAEREIVLLAHTLGGAVRPIDAAHFRSDEAVEGNLPKK